MNNVGQKKSNSQGFVSSIWQFEGSGGLAPYRWYGTLPEQLVGKILDVFGENSNCMVDPFLGTGTSAVLAAQRGIRAQGIDVNPLSCLITKLRLHGSPPSSESVNEAMLRILERCKRSRSKRNWQMFFSNEEYEYSRKWWREDSLIETLKLFWSISMESDPVIQSIFFVAAAEEIRNVANIDPRCTHHLVTKKKDFIDIKQGLEDEVKDVMKCLNAHIVDGSNIIVTQGDSTDSEVEVLDADLVIAHPPYLGMINYHLIHRLPTDILHYTQEMFSPESLQGLNFKNDGIKSNDVSTDSSAKYSKFISRFAERMKSVVNPSGYCIVIIGDQRNKGIIRHPFTEFISEFEAAGFQTKEKFVWVLQNNAGMHILRRGHFIDHNYILVFQNPSET